VTMTSPLTGFPGVAGGTDVVPGARELGGAGCVEVGCRVGGTDVGGTAVVLDGGGGVEPSWHVTSAMAAVREGLPLASTKTIVAPTA